MAEHWVMILKVLGRRPARAASRPGDHGAVAAFESGAFDAIAEKLVQAGVQDILVVVLPTDRAMIHLDMIFTMVDRDHCVIFPPRFMGPDRCASCTTMRAGKGMREMPNLFAALREVDLPLEPIFCGGTGGPFQEREQWSSGCNFVAVRPGLMLGYSRNEKTYEEMEREAGYRIVSVDFLTGPGEIEDDEKAVITFEGAELVPGAVGGARCMTLPSAPATIIR